MYTPALYLDLPPRLPDKNFGKDNFIITYQYIAS
nr:MAG TPA: hypothetical protein [Bacteriophage sp.]DAR41941.1 MAG TPA: hypothetical protein [Bacteriophage sp.]DAT77278.1 MAG TPA: hypothetical protein [Caudoviricetes sp.]